MPEEPARNTLAPVLPARLDVADDPPTTAPRSNYVVLACTLRSGSNFLAEMLRENGFGEPKEWFQAGSPGHDLAFQASQLNRQTKGFLAEWSNARWRGVKFDWAQFQYFRTLAPNQPDSAALLQGVTNGHWIFLRRRDLAAQAVSLYAAQLTNAWMGEQTVDYERVPEDFDAIYERFAALVADEFSWTEFFRARGVTPLRLYHEDLIGWNADAWLALMRQLAPNFKPEALSLYALETPPRQHARLAKLKSWFHRELTSGRRPRSVLTLLEEIGRVIARVEQTPAVDGVIGSVAADFISGPKGFSLRKLDLSRDLHREGSTSLVSQDHFLDRVALRLDPDSVCTLVVKTHRVMLQFYAHAWSGVAEIRINEVVEQVDLFSERADTRHFIRDLPAGVSCTISIQSGETRNLLSKGSEVWLQRIFVLDKGDT